MRPTIGSQPRRSWISRKKLLERKRTRKKGSGCSCKRCSGQITSYIVIEEKAMKRFLTRRQALQEAAIGFGAMAVNSMLQQERLFAAESASAKERVYDLTPKRPHFAPKAKRVIFIYIGGGPSTIDMFDPKPALMKYDGKPAPFEMKRR